MAARSVLVSDISGAEVAEKDYAQVVVIVGGKRYELDASASEVKDLVAKGTERKMRGRPKTKA